MNNIAPAYLAPFELTGVVASVAALLFGLYSSLKRARLPVRDRRVAVWSAAGLLAAWFFATLLATVLGSYRGVPSGTPTIQYGLLIPIVVGVVLFWKWPALKRVVRLVPQEWMVGIQAYRALGLIFLLLYAGGYLPGAFALPAGIGDVIVGLSAPIAGIAFARGSRGSAAMVRAWNLFGIADLMVAVGTGFLTAPSRFQMLAFDRPNELISAFPLALIPVFLVPLSVLLHLASLAKLRRTETGPGGVPNPLLAGVRG
jgi:hypothetical protein